MGLVWQHSLGRRPVVSAQRGGGGGGGGGGGRGNGGGGGGNGGRDGGGNNAAGDGLLRFEIFARATNVLNLVNPQNFSGVMTSDFFGLATSASAARRLVVGTRFFF